jgi:outer membrane protein OmpA-like peptidoglycan-associated protein
MDSNIIDQAKSVVTPEIIQKVASSTGESPQNIGRAIHGAFPTLLAGLAHRASSPEGASSILDALKRGDYTGTAEGPGTEGGGAPELQDGHGLVTKIFGDRGPHVAEALAAHSGIKSSSASHILALAAPLVAGLVGREVVSGGAGGLMQKLASHKKAILEDPNTPSGLGSALGSEGRWSGEEPYGVVQSQRPTRPGMFAAGSEEPRRVEEPRRFEEPRWVEQRSHGVGHKRPAWGLILALGAIALGLWGIFGSLRGRVPERGVTERQVMNAPQQVMNVERQVMHAPSPESRPAPTPAASGPGATTQLPNGKTLNLEPGSPEAEFADTLGDHSAPLPRKFQLDSLRFETGSATLPGDARTTVDSLAATLLAYPSSRVRVDGYTDTAGDEPVNQTLSWARANSIKTALVERGVSADRIDVAGQASNGQVARNDSDRGRMLNRRSEVTLLSR